MYHYIIQYSSDPSGANAHVFDIDSLAYISPFDDNLNIESMKLQINHLLLQNVNT